MFEVWRMQAPLLSRYLPTRCLLDENRNFQAYAWTGSLIFIGCLNSRMRLGG